MDKLHIVVLMGGWSAEREVSLTSGRGVAEALEGRGHRVTRIDMDRNVAQRLDIGTARLAEVEEEVAMFFRNLGIADAKAPAACRVDQLPGLGAGRILEG